MYIWREIRNKKYMHILYIYIKIYPRKLDPPKAGPERILTARLEPRSTTSVVPRGFLNTTLTAPPKGMYPLKS